MLTEGNAGSLVVSKALDPIPQPSFHFLNHFRRPINAYYYLEEGGRSMIGISGSLIWSKTLMELIFKPYGEFRGSPEGPVSQIHSLSSPPHWCPWDLFKVCSDAKERVGCRKQWEATAPIQSLVKLQPWFLSLRWNTCLQ